MKVKKIINTILFKKIISLFTFYFLLFTFNSYAQSQKQLIKVGDQLFAEGDYYGASKWYNDALQIDSVYLELKYKYAEALRLYNDYAKAESQYYYIYKKDNGRNFPLAPFWYSTMLKYNGEYNEAKKYFKRSKRLFTKDKKGYHYQKVMQEIKSCEEAIKLMKDSLPIDIKNIGNSINTYNSELGATLINDTMLIYSSLRDEKMKDDNEVSDTSQYLVRLFKATKNGELWVQDSKLEEKINEQGFHIANGSIDEAGTTFYYNKCDNRFNCKIYAISFVNNTWGEPTEVPNINQENSTATQPFITEVNNQEVLLFSSNREGGKGGMDIWYSRKVNGSFQTPANVGEKINTIEDEITPFYDSNDSLLYFSSNWHYGLGGFDIFKVKTDLIQTQEIENLGYPINTSTNDFYYSIKNNTALITSNRKGSYTKKGETCCNDIYYYEIPDTIKTVFTTLEELNKYLPVRLYFHNDHPNPRTRDTLTDLNYLTTYKGYTRLYNEYKREYAAGLKGDEKEDAFVDIEDLFSSYIDKGASDLEMFTPLLIKELEKGKEITLTIKGFASPLSKSDYNVNLTLRRVSSLINFLSEYENGMLLPYINGTAENGGKLNFVKVPFGEYQAVKTISDDIDDKRNSVYSPGAALERKIEIIAISVNDSNNVTLDGSEMEKLPLLTFKDTILTFSEGQLEKRFKIINNGEAPLQIFSAEFCSEGFEISYPTGEIPVLTPVYITIKRTITSQHYCELTLLTNTIPNVIKKRIKILK
ncbi:MAG: tetratricopeptide repeat protein [Flavobacteriales bacterium]|nr:tetratricopeptide repeat protein [Flavobacteriales bacterium]MCB9363262.1 tetratricopeptide repeat protein [Flavobacteriales bacterium]